MVIIYDELNEMSEQLMQVVLVQTVQTMTPAQRRAWLFRPAGVGILAERTHAQVRGGGAGYGNSDSGPREVTLGRSGHPVGWRRGRGART